jgi:hypothetical protein
MNKKKNLGQFFTTNYEYILEGFNIPNNIKNIIEPFTGNGDLLKFVGDKEYNIEKYDIDPKNINVIKKDTLKTPPDYINKFILTNPPYLARNKCSDKDLFDMYNTNDLYKCFLETIIKDNPLGGIIIIPLNFWCSIRESDINLRKRFLKIFTIIKLNIFEEQVFDDTSYTVCSFQFILDKKEDKENKLYIKIYPSKKELNIILNNENNYTIGGDIYKLPQNKQIKIDRLTTKNSIKKDFITNINMKCMDDSLNNKICLNFVNDDERIIDNTKNSSFRSYGTLIIQPSLTKDEQKNLVNKFNKFLNDKRDKYNSLFLTNYRESKDIARKRISFGLVYEIINYLLNQ